MQTTCIGGADFREPAGKPSLSEVGAEIPGKRPAVLAPSPGVRKLQDQTRRGEREREVKMERRWLDLEKQRGRERLREIDETNKKKYCTVETRYQRDVQHRDRYYGTVLYCTVMYCTVFARVARKQREEALTTSRHSPP
jgi:hypothetical protein